MTATAPIVSAISFDKTSYSAGNVITATVNYKPGYSSHNYHGTGTDTTTGAVGSLDFEFTVADSTVLTVADQRSRAWTKVSDTGTVAVFTATA
jgi:hypothetical protein